MDCDNLIEEYLAKAADAEQQANRCRDSTLRDGWHQIALSYQAMAQHHIRDASLGADATAVRIDDAFVPDRRTFSD